MCMYLLLVYLDPAKKFNKSGHTSKCSKTTLNLKQSVPIQVKRQNGKRY